MHLQKAAEEAPEDAGVWLWMAWFADSPLNAIHCLELALDDQRYHELAQAGLNWARAMAAFKVAECNDVATGAAMSVEGASLTVPASQFVVDVEHELAAHVADVAAEIASTVAPTEAVFAAELDGSSEVPVVAEESVDVPAASDATAPGDWDTVALKSGAATVLVAEHTPSQPVAAAAEWFSASRAFPSGSTRASLWGGLAASVEAGTPPVAEVAKTSPTPVVEQPPVDSDWDQPWQTASRVDLSPPTEPASQSGDSFEPVTAITEPTAVVVAPADVATPTAPLSEPESVSATMSVASQPTSPASVISAEPQPTIWRAAKTDWFGAEAVSRPEPVISVASARLADSIFAPPPVSSTEPQVVPVQPLGPMRVVEPTITTDFAGRIPDVDEHGGHGDFLEDQLADSAADELDELVDVVESVATETDATARTDEVPYTNTAFRTKAGKTVLVVDDSPTVRKLVAMTLEKRGFTVVSAFDGVAAIKEIATHNPDLILMDVTMPRLDGYQLCKLVKKHEATRHIPVIMLSGKDGMFDRLRGRLVGCSGYISKPFVPEALVEAVEEQLRVMTG